MNTQTRFWLHGLGAAFIGGAANAVPLVIVAPESFNFGSGFITLLSVSAASGILFASAYLKQSPLPALVSQVTTQETTVIKTESK